MNTIDCQDWAEFEQHVGAMKPTFKRDPSTGQIEPKVVFGSLELLFRGQADATWKLETTLERAGRGNFACDAYQRLIQSIKDEIEAFSGRSWVWEELKELSDNLPSESLAAFPESAERPVKQPGNKIANFAYMSYLRHFGFPSPLLDWTQSYYIAAFFGAASNRDTPWAIFVHDEHPMNTVSPPRPYIAPTIATITQTSNAQQRQFLQQSRYTVCTKFDRTWRFAGYDTAFVDPHPIHSQVTKFVFHQNIRGEVCKMLRKMNINAYSLFGTEESLISTLSSRFIGP